MAEIRWTEEALRWLEDIYEYVFVDDPAAASRILQGIFSQKRNATLGEYYIRMNDHLIPDDVEFWEFDEAADTADRLR